MAIKTALMLFISATALIAAHAAPTRAEDKPFVVYVTNQADNTISVIDGKTRIVTATHALNPAPAQIGGDHGSAGHSMPDKAAPHAMPMDPIMDANMMNDYGPHHVAFSKEWCGGSVDLLRGGVSTAPCPGPRWLFTSNIVAGSVSAIDLATGKSAYVFRAGTKSHGIALTPDQREIWVANKGGTVGVIDLATRTLAAEIEVPFNSTWTLFSRDGKTAYVNGKRCAERQPGVHYTGDDCTYSVAVIDVPTRRITSVMALPKGTKAKPVAAGATQDYARENDHHIVSLVRTGATEQIRAVEIDTYAHGAIASLDGKHIFVTVPSHNHVAVVDARTGVLLKKIPVGENPHIASISPDGSEVWVVCRKADKVDIISTASLSVIASVPVGLRPHGIIIASK